MEKAELYDKIRFIIGRGRNEIETGRASVLPKHPVTEILLMNLFTEKEAELIVACFDKCGEALAADELAKKADIPVSELTSVFDDMDSKGKLMKIRGNRYLLLPYVPSTSERYFIRRNDDPDRMKKVAEAQTELWNLGLLDELNRIGYPTFRVIPSIEPVKRTITLNEEVESEHQVMPYEQLEERIAKVEPQKFAVFACPCRTARELAGQPCRVTSDDFCTVVGKFAENIIKEGIGREVTKAEYLDIMKQAEQLGLVHQTSNIQDSTLFICNCCSCCCPHLISRKKLNEAGNTAKSNFLPEIDHDACILCEDCVNVCPMEAVYHHWPHLEDGSDEYIRSREEVCIGCGDCAAVCPNEAITLKKISSDDPVPSYLEMIDEFAGKFQH
jgi:ferredoxin